jgi:hypothetical protein
LRMTSKRFSGQNKNKKACRLSSKTRAPKREVLESPCNPQQELTHEDAK